MTSLKVAVRVRPLSDKECIRGSKVVVDVCGKDILVTDVKVPGKYGCDHRIRVHRFTFDYGFWSVEPSSNKCASQRAVYEDFGRVVLNTLLSGYNSCVIAYGPSGSGKTYTMMGNKDDTGLTPRICEGLFTKLTDKSDQQTPFQVDISFMEIYNEQVFDLLKKNESQNNRKPKLRVREHPIHGPFVEGLSTHIVKNIDEVCDLLARGNEARVKADTHIHDRSSRSHAIFTIRCSQACLDEDKPREVISKLHLVDLAGSEKAVPEFCPSRIKEGGNINKSLVTLGNVISVLVELSKQGKTSHKQIYVPYRDSNLTWLLKDSLGGNSHTFMLAAVSPSKECYIETVSTLRYAQRAKLVLNTPVVNEDPSTEMIRNLRKEVAKLKNLLATAEELSKGYIMKPLPEISQLKSIMNESARRVDVLTKHWFEKWLRTYDVVLKKFDGMERTDFGCPEENGKETSCTRCSKTTLEESNSQTESSECVVMCNDTVGFFKQKPTKKNHGMLRGDLDVAFSDVLSTEALQIDANPSKEAKDLTMGFKEAHFKSFSTTSLPHFLPKMKIDSQLTSSHSLSKLNNLYYSTSWLEMKDMRKEGQDTDSPFDVVENVYHPQDSQGKKIHLVEHSPFTVHEQSDIPEIEFQCDEALAHSKEYENVQQDQEHVGHLVQLRRANVNQYKVESGLSSDFQPAGNFECNIEKVILKDAIYPTRENDILHAQPVLNENKAINLEETLGVQNLYSEPEEQTVYQNVKNLQLSNVTVMENNTAFNERVSEESKQMLELLKSIRPDSVESSSGCWTPRRKDSEIMSLLSFSSLDGQYLRSLDDISSNEETASVCNSGRKESGISDLGSNRKIITDCRNLRIPDNSQFKNGKSIFSDDINKSKIPHLISGFGASEFEFAKMFENKYINNENDNVIHAKKGNSLTPINRTGFSLHLPQKKKIDWMLENNGKRIVDISFKDAPYKANRCRKLQLTEDNYLTLCKHSGIQKPNGGYNAVFTDECGENYSCENKLDKLKTTGLKLTKANLDRLAMELKAVSMNSHNTTDEVIKSFNEKADHYSEFNHDSNTLGEGIIFTENYSPGRTEEREKNIFENASGEPEVDKNEYLFNTSAYIDEVKLYCDEAVPGQFWQSFDAMVCAKKEDTNLKEEVSKLSEEDKVNCLKATFSNPRYDTLQNQEFSIVSSTTNSNNRMNAREVNANNFWPIRESATISNTKVSENFPSTVFYCDKLSPISEEHRIIEKSEKETESDFNDSLTLDSLDNFDQEMNAWANKYLTKYDSLNSNFVGCDRTEKVDAMSEQASVLDLKEFELITTSAINQHNNEGAPVDSGGTNRIDLSSYSNYSSSDSITYVFVGTEENVIKAAKTIEPNSHCSSMISSVSLDSLEKTAFNPKVSTCLSPRTLSIDSLVAEELFQQLCNNDLLQVQNKFVNRCSNQTEIENFKDTSSNYQTSFNSFSKDSRNIHFKANIPEPYLVGNKQSSGVQISGKDVHKISEEDNSQAEITTIGFDHDSVGENSRLMEDECSMSEHQELLCSTDYIEKTSVQPEEGVIHEACLHKEIANSEMQQQLEIPNELSLTKGCQMMEFMQSDEQCNSWSKKCEQKSRYTQTEEQIITESCPMPPNTDSTTKDVLHLTSRLMEFMTEMIQYLKRDRYHTRPKRYESRKLSCDCKHSCRKLEHDDTTSDSCTSLTDRQLFEDETVPCMNSSRNCGERRCLKKRKETFKRKSVTKQHNTSNAKDTRKLQTEICCNRTTKEQSNACKQHRLYLNLPKTIRTGTNTEKADRSFSERKNNNATNMVPSPECDAETNAFLTTTEKYNKKFTSFSEISQKGPKNHLKNLVEIRRRIVQETKPLPSEDQLSKDCSQEGSIIRFHRKSSNNSTSESEGYLSSLSSHTAKSSYSDNQVPNISSHSSDCRQNLSYPNSVLRNKPLCLNVNAEAPVPAMPSTSWQNTSADSGAFFMDSPLMEKVDLHDFVQAHNNTNAINKKNSETTCKKKSLELSTSLMTTRQETVQEECKASTSATTFTSSFKYPLATLPSDSTGSTNRRSPYFHRESTVEVHPAFRHLEEDDIDLKTIDSLESTSMNSRFDTTSTLSDDEYCKSNTARLEFAKKLSDSNYKLTKRDIEQILLSIEADKKFLRRRRNPILDRAYSPEINLCSSSSSEQSIFSCSSYKKLPNPILYLTPLSSGLAT